MISFFEEKFNLSKGIGKVHIQRFLHQHWKGFKHAARADFEKHYPNEMSPDLLKFISDKIVFLLRKKNLSIKLSNWMRTEKR